MKKYNIYHDGQLVRSFVTQETIMKQFRVDTWEEAKEFANNNGYVLRLAK